MKKLDSKYKLILVGQGGMFDQVKKQTEEMDLGDRVIFTGSVHNVPDYLSAMDVFVLPSSFCHLALKANRLSLLRLQLMVYQ
ncbi:glycosyltransferase [Lactobacillus delbrueckii subsp. bulgaricus]